MEDCGQSSKDGGSSASSPSSRLELEIFGTAILGFLAGRLSSEMISSNFAWVSGLMVRRMPRCGSVISVPNSLVLSFSK